MELELKWPVVHSTQTGGFVSASIPWPEAQLQPKNGCWVRPLVDDPSGQGEQLDNPGFDHVSASQAMQEEEAEEEVYVPASQLRHDSVLLS